MTEQETIERMSKALGVWAKRNNITPIIFKRKMKWSYHYAWRVLRGRDAFSDAAWGRFALCFGSESLLELFLIAGLDPNKKLTG